MARLPPVLLGILGFVDLICPRSFLLLINYVAIRRELLGTEGLGVVLRFALLFVIICGNTYT